MNATEVVSSPSRHIKTAATDANHFILTFENNRLASELFGQFDQHLKLLEQRLQIEARARGNSVAITVNSRRPTRPAGRSISSMPACRAAGPSKPPTSKVRSAWRSPPTTS